jgi:hypothetical protein
MKPILMVVMTSIVLFPLTANANIYQWTYSPEGAIVESSVLCMDGAGVSAAPGVDLSNRRLMSAYLIDAVLNSATLTNVNLSGADLTRANLSNAALTSANLTGANLTGSVLTGTTFTNVDLTAADLRGASGLSTWLPDVTLHNTISPEGYIGNPTLDSYESLVIHNHPVVPITFLGPVDINGGLIELVLDDGAWNSTISFSRDDPFWPVRLDGWLYLTFAPGVDFQSKVGTKYKLFDWGTLDATGYSLRVAQPIGGGCGWDDSELLTTGMVTFLGLPEPGSFVLLLTGLLAFLACARATSFRRGVRGAFTRALPSGG